jgi:hypothetical protein
VSARTPRVAQLQGADTLARRQRCCTAWTWLFGWADFVRHKVIVANGPLAQGAVWRMQHQEQHRHNGGRPHDTGAQLTPQSTAPLHRLQILVSFHLLSLAVARLPSPRHLCAQSLVGPKCSARPMSWALRANGTSLMSGTLGRHSISCKHVHTCSSSAMAHGGCIATNQSAVEREWYVKVAKPIDGMSGRGSTSAETRGRAAEMSRLSGSQFFVKPAQSVVLLCSPNMSKLGEKVRGPTRAPAAASSPLTRPCVPACCR